MTSVLVKVSLQEYLNAFATARSLSARVRQNTSSAAMVSTKVANAFWASQRASPRHTHVERVQAWVDQHTHIYLAKAPGQEVTGGFLILDGELMGFWGPKIGEWLLRAAIKFGADRLDCFDGWLTAYYTKWGFREILREPNYFKGGRMLSGCGAHSVSPLLNGPFGPEKRSCSIRNRN